MTTRTSEDSSTPSNGARARFELLFASIWLAIGLFVLPAVVYWVGLSLLGPYSETTSGAKASLSAFYGAFFGDLASLTTRAWLLALGPLLLMTLVRLIYLGVPAGNPKEPDDEEAVDTDKRRRPVTPASRRVEPRVGG